MTRTRAAFAVVAASLLAIALAGAVEAGKISPRESTADLSLAAPGQPAHRHRRRHEHDGAGGEGTPARQGRRDRPGSPARQQPAPRQINRLVDAGGFRKPCNTTGTATNRGFPESTFTWRVSLVARAPAAGEGRHRLPDASYELVRRLGSLHRRPRTQGQPGRRGRGRVRARRRRVVHGPRVLRHPAGTAARVDRRHRQAVATARPSTSTAACSRPGRACRTATAGTGTTSGPTSAR